MNFVKTKATFGWLQESEAEMRLKKAQELAEAELNAAIANEKSAQLEKLIEAYVDVRILLKLRMARWLYLDYSLFKEEIPIILWKEMWFQVFLWHFFFLLNVPRKWVTALLSFFCVIFFFLLNAD